MTVIIALFTGFLLFKYGILRLRARSAYYGWPIIVFGAMFYSIHFVMPELNQAVGAYRFSAFYSSETRTWSAIQAAIFLLVVICAFEVTISRRVGEAKDISYSGSYLLLRNVGILCVLIGAMFSIMVVANIIAIGGVRVYFTNRIYYAHGLGYAVALSNLFPVGAICLSYVIAATRRFGVTFWLWILVSVAFWLTVCAARGTRLEFFMLVAPLALAFLVGAVKNPHRSLIRWGPVGILVFLMGAMIGGYRRSFVTGEAVQFSGLELVRALNGVIGNHENLLWLTEMEPPLLWGSTYLAGFTNLIPRALWPNKPTGGGPALVNLIFPDQYYVGASGVSSYTTGLLPEAVMNFGLVGVILVAGVTGITIAGVCRLIRNRADPFRVVIGALGIYFTCLIVPFSEFLGAFTLATVMLTPLVLCALMRRAGCLRA